MTTNEQALSERLLLAGKGRDWRGVFELSETVFEDAENPDDIFLAAWKELSGVDSDTFLEVARDAAGEYLVDDSFEEDGVHHKVEVGLSLFAVPFMMKPGFVATRKDFDLLGDCISKATDGQPVVMVPRIVSAEDFLSATPEGVRYAVQMIDYNIANEQDNDPLDQIVTSTPPSGPRLLAIVVGARLQRFDGGADVIPSNWTHKWDDDAYERLRSLLKTDCAQFELAEWPMSFGRCVPTVKSRLRIEQIVLGVAEAAEKYNVLPEVTVYEEGGKSFVSMSAEGVPAGDVVIDRNGTSLDEGEVARLLKQVTPSIRVAADAADFSKRVRQGAALN